MKLKQTTIYVFCLVALVGAVFVGYGFGLKGSESYPREVFDYEGVSFVIPENLGIFERGPVGGDMRARSFNFGIAKDSQGKKIFSELSVHLSFAPLSSYFKGSIEERIEDRVLRDEDQSSSRNSLVRFKVGNYEAIKYNVPGMGGSTQTLVVFIPDFDIILSGGEDSGVYRELTDLLTNSLIK